jgi:hypothetical protein
MPPEDGIISVYGTGENYTPAFTDHGIETLRQIVEIHKANTSKETKDVPISPEKGLIGRLRILLNCRPGCQRGRWSWLGQRSRPWGRRRQGSELQPDPRRT